LAKTQGVTINHRCVNVNSGTKHPLKTAKTARSLLTLDSIDLYRSIAQASTVYGSTIKCCDITFITL